MNYIDSLEENIKNLMKKHIFLYKFFLYNLSSFRKKIRKPL